MPPKSARSNLFNSIIPFCQDPKSFHAKLAILSCNYSIFPNLVELLWLIVEYFQLLSQVIIVNYKLQETGSAWTSEPLYNTFVVFAKIFSPGYFMPLEGKGMSSVLGVGIVMTILCMIKYALFWYIVVIILKNWKENKFLLRVWGFIFRCNARVLFFIDTSFWAKIICSISQGELDLNEGEKGSFIAWAVFMIILESVMAFGKFAFIQYKLPSKSILASKDHHLEIITLTQKFIFLMCIISQIPTTLATAWILSILSLAISLIRNGFFFRTLPYYKNKVNSYQLGLLMTVTSMSIAYLAHTILRSAYGEDEEVSPNFAIITWIVLSFLTIKSGITYLGSIITNLLTQWEIDTPERMVHKIIALQELIRQKQIPSKHAPKFRWRYLLNISSAANLSQILNLSPEDMATIQIDLESKESLKQLFLLYLENLLIQFPQSEFLKLYLAYYYGKRLEIYGLSMNILINLRKSSPSFLTELNISLLLNKMQRALIFKHQIRINGDVDLHTYIQSFSKFEKLKEMMLKHAETQINLCQEMIKDTAGLSKVYELSQKVIHYRRLVKQASTGFFSVIPDYFIEPLAVFAHYHLVMNYSIKAYLKLFKNYDLKEQKYKQRFSLKTLCQENIFQKGNLRFVLSGRKEDMATIVYASESTFPVYGRNVVGEKGYGVVTPALRKYFQIGLQYSLERGDPTLMGVPVQSFQCHKEGYITPSYFYMNLSPILSQDLYYFVVIKLIQTKKEFIILNEDGTIDSCSKNVGYDLGLLPLSLTASHHSPTNISKISKELSRANQAFNIKAFPEKYEKKAESPQNKLASRSPINEGNLLQSSFEVQSQLHTMIRRSGRKKSSAHEESISLKPTQAENIVSIYTTEGKTIRLSPLDKKNPFLWFNCKIENQVYGSILLKILTLEDVGQTNQEKNDYKVKAADRKLTKIQYQSKPEIIVTERNALTTNLQTSNITAGSALDVSDLSHAVEENEKEDGWIDLRKFRSNNDQSPAEISFDPLSPFSPGESITQTLEPPSSKRILLPKSNFSRMEDKSESKIPSLTEEPSPMIKEISSPVKILQLENDDKNSKSNHSSSISTQLKVFKVFHEATKTKYVPKFFRIFKMLWYGILITMLVNQFQLNLTGTSEMRNFDERKNLMMMSDSRSDSLASIHMHIRSLLVNAKLPLLDPSQDVTWLILLFLKGELNSLRTYNHGLLEATGDFDDESRTSLFQKDIRMFDTSYQQLDNLTCFQAADQIIETGLKGVSEMAISIDEATPELELVLMNDLNDVLLKSDTVSHMILDIAAQSAQNVLDSFSFSLIISIFAILLMAVIFSVLVYFQYNDDVKNMAAFVKIKRSGIETVLRKATLFKKMLQEDSEFERNQDEKVIKTYLDEFCKSNASNNKNVKSAGSVNLERVSMRFYFYVGKTVLLLIILAVLIWVNQITTGGSLRSNEKKLYQISFSNDLKFQVNLILSTALEIMSDPNRTSTILIRNNPIHVDILTQMTELANMVSQVPTEFKENDIDYDPTIEEILFGNACLYLDSVTKVLCPASDGNGVGLIQSLNDLEFYIENIVTQNLTIDSIDDLKSIVIRDFYMLVTFATVTNVLNNNFDQDIDEDVFYNILLNVIITLSMIVICIGVHIFILRKVSQSNNNFKRILETFPARLILSNFILKSYLSKTSNGALDAIKEEI